MQSNTPAVLVSGGAQRIGAAICQRLHADGYHVALHYRSSASEAEALAAQLNAQRPESCSLWQADLTNLDQLRTMAEQLAARHGGLAALVNNASAFAPTPIEQCTPDQFDTQLDSNLKAPYFLTQALLPALRNAGGCIVNIIDVHADQPLPDYNSYCASKAGLASLTRSLAVELAPAVRVNGVAPGAILWPEEAAGYDEAQRAATLAATPLARLGEPADIATTVSFLINSAAFITGQVIAVDGGRSLTASSS